ncbi:hypothetical protein F941_00509 [Acinetobacter bouvetii DSM 14964 = CIP 107468]|uniref:Uncharacterized protein n=1 Tax=Acinetobacter bouvetii DSM 14964 = CIP 107468 TaxID=1120925 RepID=N9DTZ8_9GAMM|nr:hypothetical protein [Acinetobacter bouvetii]ENV84100.1 hypothetical protein F941_00509 [Acinetobacter bouvetii DSM 14964 = CIP 107468]BCU65838.1 hypothetical protein ACBO_26290 [Acinetobacter bouvetii]
MNKKTLLCIAAVAFSSLSSAESPAVPSGNEQLKSIGSVRVSMQRMLRSTDGRYFLDLYAGIWNPHGVLKDLAETKSIAFKGNQKGDQLNLKSVSVDSMDESAPKYELSGKLDANTGLMASVLASSDAAENATIHFEPAFKAADKPIIVFKFYGAEGGSQPYGKALKRLDIINKANNSVMQSLTGFTAYAGSIGFLDVNFDGYYDVVLADTSDSRKVEDKRFIYWMYNPKTKQFQRSPQLEKIAGFPALHGEKQQIDFGNAQLYQVQNGLLNRIQE